VSKTSANADARALQRRTGRRWRWLLIVLAGLGALPWVIPPGWVADLVLGQLGPALQLELTRSGTARWRLRGGPMLEVHGLDIGKIGADSPWLHADRLLLSVPWKTVRRLGKALDFTQIEIDSPHLNLPALRLWLDSRTPGDGDIPLPTLSSGLTIHNGHLQADQWQISDITLQLPEFNPGLPIRSQLSGHYTDTAIQAGFDLRLALTRPSLPAGAAVVGQLDIQRDTAAIPVQFTLSGRLHHQAGQWQVPALRLALQGTWSAPDAPLRPFAVALKGALKADKTITLSPLTLELTGSGPIPSLHATGEAIFSQDLHLHLNGQMPLWPRTWPALPRPLSQKDRFGFTLDYTGALDLGGELHLQLHHGPTRLDATLNPSALGSWLSRSSRSPLPPLQGRLSTPTLELPGASLSGVVIESEP